MASKSQRFRVFERDGFRCMYCGGGSPEVRLELDHIHPRALGGKDVDENLLTSCYDCNRGKRAATIDHRNVLNALHKWASTKLLLSIGDEDGGTREDGGSPVSDAVLLEAYIENHTPYWGEL